MRFPARVAHHGFAAIWVAGMLLFASQASGRYAEAMQEDRLVEWTTAIVYAIAGAVHLRRGFRQRRLFDGLVGAFCLFVAGEEVSWGQRLLGFMPPAPFLAHNTQQELTLHNFADFFGKPKWVLAAALIAYGVLLPVSQKLVSVRSVAARVGATAPANDLVFWFGLCAALLVWYPVEFTGEWVELLSSTLFLAAGGLHGARFWSASVIGLVAAGALVVVPRHARDDAARTACARLEVAALLHDLIVGRAANASLVEFKEVDKRILSAADGGYLDFALIDSLDLVRCSGDSHSDAAARREYAVDPWGSAYWLRTRLEASSGLRLDVYSFGPNRRRDDDLARRGKGDDIIAAGRYVP